jgi:alpha-ketoglutarate-dependent 2,4-dichlorophenoxyacetate dioxygenase
MLIDPVTPHFVAEVGDVDLSKPLDEADWNAIQKAFWKYAVLIFPDQELTTEQHLEFARRFGPLQTSIEEYRPGAELRVPAEIADVSNLTAGDEIWEEQSPRRLHEMGNRLWHTDSSFRHVPALASLLYARSVPPWGGRTEFADLRAAYDAVPESEKLELENLVAEHCIRYSRARIGFTDFSEQELQSMPPVPQVIIRRIVQTGRKTLYLAAHAGRVFGLADQAGQALIDDLIAHATRPEFVYIHRWRVNDLVMWDDRCTMHRGTPFDDLRFPRDVQRATVSDVANTCEQEGIPLPGSKVSWRKPSFDSDSEAE